MEILPVLLFLVLIIPLTVPECDYHYPEDCNDAKYIRCAYCKSGKCDYFLSANKIFKPDTPCEYISDHCKTDGCEEKTKESFEGYGTCVCSCETGYYGPYCAYKGDPSTDYPTGVQIIYPSSAKHFSRTPGFLLVQSGGGRRFTYILREYTGGFALVLNAPTGKNPENPHLDCNKKATDKNVCKFFKTGMREIFLFDLELPLRYNNVKDTLSDGYVTHLTLTIHDNYFNNKESSILDASNNYIRNIHVKFPQDYSPIPFTRIINCNSDFHARTKYRLRDSFQLTCEINFINNNNTLQPNAAMQQRVDYKWQTNIVKREFWGFDRNLATHYQFDTPTWNVHMHSWRPGIYIVRLTTTIVERGASNFDQCYLEVITVPLKAVLVGGSARSVKTEDGVVLDGTGSTDPNVPDKDVRINYFFSCNWTEEAVCNTYYTTTKIYKPYAIAPNILHPGQVYLFTLMVKTATYDDIPPAYAYQFIFVIDPNKKPDDTTSNTTTPMTEPSHSSVELECIYNCEAKSNPQDITYLRVKGPWKELRNLEFVWVSVNGEVQSVEDMRANTPSFILIILANKLAEDRKYNFKANVRGSDSFAVYSFTTSALIASTCLAEPTSGIKGVTSFNISCKTDNTDPDVHLSYEFYDKNESDGPEFSGRMLATQNTGSMDTVLLTRGKVEILIYDESGMVTVNKIDVTMSEYNMTAEDVEKSVTDLVKLSGIQDVSVFLRRASVLSDLLKPEMNRDDLLEVLIASITGIRIQTLAEVKICTSTLYNIMVMISQRENFTLSLDGAFHASHVLKATGETLARTMPVDSQCTFHSMYVIFRVMLDCIYLVLEVKNKEMKTEPFEYANPRVYSQVKGISRNVMDCVWNMAYTLLRRHLPSQPHEQIVSKLGNVSMWIKVDFPERMSKFTLDHNGSDKFPITISRKLAKMVEDLDSYIGLQYTSLEQNPLPLKKVNTETFDVNFCYKLDNGQCDYPQRLKYPIGLAFNVEDIISEVEYIVGSVVQLDPSLSPDQLDFALTVYRLDVAPDASLHLEFQFDSDAKEIKVMVEKCRRPDYEMVVKNGSIVTANNSVYHVASNHGDEPTFYYLAILPAPSVAKNAIFNIKLKAYSKVCYSWHGEWDSKNCQVKESPNKDFLICKCSRLSLFSALVEVPPLALDVVQDFPLLFTEFSSVHNQWTLPAVLLLVIMALVLFAAWIDRRNRVKRFAVVLKDNFPGNRYGYLICINTGARIGAGTDAPIGIRLYGDTNDSRPHILASDQHDVMEGLGEDWFVLYTPTLLGHIKCVDIWHDNTGNSPDWFCDSVLIYDLTKRNCYFFLVNEWVTLSFKRVPQIIVFPTTVTELASGPRIFLDNLKSGFVLSHLWMSTIVRHPRDPVTRVDRLAIILCFILVSMTTGVGLIRLTDDYIEIDDFAYTIDCREFVFSLFSLAAGTTAVCILTEMFRKIYKIIFFRENDTNEGEIIRNVISHQKISPDNTDPNINFLHYGHLHLNQKKENFFWDNVNIRLMSPPLIPVQLQGDEPNLYLNRILCVITWLMVLGIVVACLILCVVWSRELPPVKTKKWLTIAGLAVLEHIFVLLPIKIILTSLLLALAFKRIIYKDIYTFDPKDGTQMDHFGDRKHLMWVINQRYHPMYLPLHECLKEEHRQESIRRGKWRNLFHLLQMLALLAVLSGVLTTNSFVYYHSNAHLHNLLGKARTTSRLGYYNIFNESDYKSFFYYSLDNLLCNFGWYNLESLNTGDENKFYRRDWLSDGTYRMLGRVRSRQLRVAPGSCKAPDWAQNATRDLGCAAPWSRWNEDKTEYGVMWLNPENNPDLDKGANSLYTKGILEFSNKWRYTGASDDLNFCYYGKTGNFYQPGGYLLDLGSSGEELEVKVMRMDEEWWLGHFTRAVLTQITAYNINTECFTDVMLVAEQTISGEYIPTIMVHSVVTSFRVHVWLVLFILFTIQFGLRLYMMMSYNGILGFFSRPSRIFEMVLFIVSVASLICSLLHHISSPNYVAGYLLAAKNDDFHFYMIANYFFTSRTLMGIVFVLALLRLYSLFRFGRFFSACFYMFVTSLRITVWVMVVLLLFIAVVWRFIGYLLSSFIEVVFRPTLFYKTNFLYLYNSDQLLLHKIIAFLVCFGSAIVIALFVCIFSYQYKYVRRYCIGDWTIVNLIAFIFEEVKSIGFEKAHQMKNLEKKLVTDYSRRLTKNVI